MEIDREGYKERAKVRLFYSQGLFYWWLREGMEHGEGGAFYGFRILH